MTTARDVLDFWFDELAEADWFNGGDAVDARVRERFLPLWEAAMEGRLGPWLLSAPETLAYVIVTDQFPRNMFRGRPESFASDPLARAAAKGAVERGWDRQVGDRERAFLYLPYEHSENLVDQDRAVALIAERLPGDANLLLHARAHREVVRRFGRFPGRNAALGRESTPQEEAWLAAGGYGAVVEAMKGGG